MDELNSREEVVQIMLTIDAVDSTAGAPALFGKKADIQSVLVDHAAGTKSLKLGAGAGFPAVLRRWENRDLAASIEKFFGNASIR